LDQIKFELHSPTDDPSGKHLYVHTNEKVLPPLYLEQHLSPLQASKVAFQHMHVHAYVEGPFRPERHICHTFYDRIKFGL
jgi:hypothetical protein